MLKDNRLKTIVSMLPRCEVIADIGADHGKMGCELLSEGICQRVWFTDISADSLKKAQVLVRKKGLTGNAAFFVGDGAMALPAAPDAAVIAGMGGLTICHIISDGYEKLKNCCMVLGAQTALPELRDCLSRNSFMIKDERVAYESGRYYVIMSATGGKAVYNAYDLIAGPVLRHKADSESRAYFAYRLKLATSIYRAIKDSQKANTDKIETEIDIWKRLV